MLDLLAERLAEAGVVLATGGFVMNEEMVARHTPALREKPFTLGSTYDDGVGIRLGASVGGALDLMDRAFVTAPFYPPSSLLTGVVVNKEGRRFVAEDGRNYASGLQLAEGSYFGRRAGRRAATGQPVEAGHGS